MSSSANPTTVIPTAPKNPPKNAHGKTMDCTIGFFRIGGCGSCSFLGSAGGSVDFMAAREGKPMAKKISPARIPADGAMFIAHVVATTGPTMNTNSSTIASHEYAVLTRCPSLLSGSVFNVCSHLLRTKPPALMAVDSAIIKETNHVQIGASFETRKTKIKKAMMRIGTARRKIFA